MKIPFPGSHSLKTRIIIVTLAVFMLSLWSLSFYVSRTLKLDMERLLGEQQFSTTSMVAANFNHSLEDRLHFLENAAEKMTPAMVNYPASAQTFLENLPELQSLFNGGLIVYSQDGTAIADSTPEVQRIGLNFMDIDTLAATLKEGVSTIGEPVIGKRLNAPIFGMHAAIRNAQGQVIGALAGVVNLGRPNFLDQLIQNHYGQTGGYMLVAPRHKLIVSATDQSRTMTPTPPPGAIPQIDRFLEGYEGSAIYVGQLGVELLVSSKRIPVADWLLATNLPTAEAFAPIAKMQRRIMLAAMLFTLLAGTLTWWMLRREFAFLISTTNTLNAMAQANHPSPALSVAHDDEIGTLIRSFNALLAKLAQREDALKKSEQDLAITLDSIGDAVIATDAQGRITRMNPTAERLTAWPLADALGRPLNEVFHIISAHTRLPAVDPVQLVLERGVVVGLANHTALLARDGHEYQIADSAAPIRDSANTIVGVVLVFSDVTEKYAAEAALIESEKRFRKLYEKAPLPYQSLDIEANILDVNEAWLTMLGYEYDEVIGRFVGDFLSEASIDTLSCEFPQFKARGHVEGSEFDITCKNGSRKRVVINGKISRDSQGEFQRTHCIVTDITERKKAEDKLKLAASVFLNAGEGIIITDAQGIIIDVNQAFSRITEYSREEAIGQNPSILQSGRHDKQFYAAIWRALAKQGHWSGEVWNRRKSGETYIELLTINAVHDAQGQTQQYVAIFSDITAIKAHQSQLEHIAHFDALTNLPNRVLLADRLQQAMSQTQRRGKQLAVAFLDLDGFKLINDHYAHAMGDKVLVMLTQRMKETLREGDTLARIGGDEFVAVFIDLNNAAESIPLVTRLLTAAAQPMQIEKLNLQVSASVGITYYPQTQDIDADQLLRQADQAMYQAKVTGKNRYQIFDAAQDINLRGHHESLERIRLALDQGEFVLYYQPKVNMRSGQVIGAEALIRWQHPEMGLLAPAAFLPTIEDHPLAVAVGEWVIDTALTQLAQWHDAGLDLPEISVNVGARQLQQGDFVERLKVILSKHPQVNPARLQIEVLETSALADMEQVSQVIEDCSRIGITFALDDFGTGYSSLTYLKRLRVAMLKIDKSFVRDMLEDPDDLAILQGVIGLAAAFKRGVIAEGVETAEHGTALLALGCELAQGYGIARPMPGNEIPAWTATWKPNHVLS